MSIFAKAKTLDKPATAKAKQDKLEIEVSQIQKISEIKALIQTLEGTLVTLETEVKDAAFDIFCGMETLTRPESFRGIDGAASASVEMRKRGTNSPLNEDEIKVLQECGIEPVKQVVTRELFAINPAYAENKTLMAKVEAALSSIKDLPDDFIVLQAEASKKVVSDEMTNQAFRNREKTMAHKAALKICTTMALKPKLNEGYPMEQLFDNVKDIVQPKALAKKSVLPKSKKAA